MLFHRIFCRFLLIHLNTMSAHTKTLEQKIPTILDMQDFRMMVETNGRINPVMLQEINHGSYTEAETFYGLADLDMGTGARKPVVLVFQIVYSTLG